MALWGATDHAANSPFFAAAQVNLTTNTANRTALFGNTTQDSFVTGQAVGVFGVDANEVSVTNGAIFATSITDAGSGYGANATITVVGNGSGANVVAVANASGKIGSILINGGGDYSGTVNLTVPAPSAVSFNANTAVDATNDFIALTGHKFENTDYVQYSVAAGNTALTNLTSGTRYYVVSANTSGVKLSLSSGGAAIDLTKGLSETGHSLTGETATAIVTGVGGGAGIAHRGWVLRTAGSGGRAGRVTYETLVAMKTSTDAGDDTVLPDA